MRIYYFGIYTNNGGLENFAKNLITAVKNNKNDINFTIIATDSNFSYRSYFESLGCDIIVIANPHKNPFKFYKELLNVLKQAEKDDVLQVNICSYRNTLLFKAIRKSKINSIIVGHYTKVDDGKLAILHYFNRWRFRKVGIKVTNSVDVTNFMFQKKSNPIFIDNGTDLTKFSFNKSNREEIRNKYKIDNKVVIGQIGRISAEKNQIFSIKVLEQIIKDEDKAVLVIVGKEMYEEPKKYVEDHKLGDKVLFLGPIYEGIEKFYSAFDICLLPSLNEGMSLSLLECASNGVCGFFSSAVPKLKVNVRSLHYFDLDVELWKKEILSNLNSDSFDPCARFNDLTDSVYDINCCAKAYINLYKKSSL